jgi:hypothetical protein
VQNIKQTVNIIILILGLLSCSNNSGGYDYIKILSISKADTVTELNKGLKLYNYLYYKPESDSAVLRFVQSVDPEFFNTYSGFLRKKEYADTLALLISLLKHHKDGFVPYSVDSTSTYCGPELYVEYSDSKGKHYNAFILDGNDTLSILSDFFHRLENLPWKKVKINNKRIDETEEVVNVLKGIGSYESIVKPYVPLPCKKGIELNKLYGSWRTIGDKYNDATFNYWINEINNTGNWIIDEVYNGKTERKYRGKIKSIKNHEIQVNSEHGLITLEILNLTDNCFEYRLKKSKQVWRLDRIK